MKIYVASSWRNERQQEVVKQLREAGHEVYDFKNPTNGDKGFSWSDIDENWQNWTNEQYQEALQHPIAKRAFKNDYTGMLESDLCVMVMPCGRSAHIEAGWMQGSGKPTIVLQEHEAEPELMYNLFNCVVDNMDDVLGAIECIEILDFIKNCIPPMELFKMLKYNVGFAQQVKDVKVLIKTLKLDDPITVTTSMVNQMNDYLDSFQSNVINISPKYFTSNLRSNYPDFKKIPDDLIFALIGDNEAYNLTENEDLLCIKKYLSKKPLK